MKAEDLMIGDWVKYITVTHDADFIEDLIIDKGQSVTEHIIKIASTDESGVFFKSKFDESFIFVSMKDVEPIPLTTEILDKNGFGFVDTSNEYYSSVWTGWWILEGLELGCCDNSKFPVFFNIADTNVRVNYVHELQHALKLCGIKKEIIL